MPNKQLKRIFLQFTRLRLLHMLADYCQPLMRVLGARKRTVDNFRFNESFVHEPNIKELREEFESLKQLLESLKELKGIDFRPIDDIPYNLGLELFFNSNKIAEIYCDEDGDEVIPNRYQVYSIINEFERQELSITECLEQFSEYVESN